MKEMPFFLTNKEWYLVESSCDDCGYLLTDKASQEAIDSHNDFYRTTNPDYPSIRLD